MKGTLVQRAIRILDLAHLWDLYRQGGLILRPEFQRNGIWPTAAKSFFVETLLLERPVPLIIFQRAGSAQTGMPGFAVIDGQQRLIAAFDFLEGIYRLSGTDIAPRLRRKSFDDLALDERRRILDYGFAVEELIDYKDDDIRDVFVRLNRYGVRLSRQELRHALAAGEFKSTVEAIGGWDFWQTERVLSRTASLRMRSDELAAELLILLAESAPQDKKAVVDDYYIAKGAKFAEAPELSSRLHKYFDWIGKALANQPKSRFRRPVGLYSLVGALDRVTHQGAWLSRLPPTASGHRLQEFEAQITGARRSRDGERYRLAESQQTDNIGPRRTRIELLEPILKGLLRAET